MVGSELVGIPTIDISALRASDAEQRAAIVAELGHACRQSGFFGIVGHGIPQDLIDAVFEGARRFFALPIETKLTVRGDMTATNRGYVPLRGERLNADLPPDCKEAFNIGLEAMQDPLPRDNEAPSPPANLWPPIPAWRDTMLAYFARCSEVGILLHEAFADTLGIDRSFFTPSLESPAAVLRLLYYPGGTGKEADAGAGEHTDYGNITILATDGVGGLEVQDRGGRWIGITGITGGFVCNIGDCLMRWTNDIFVSTPHRVIAPPAERYSVAFFLDPNPVALVETIATPEAGPSRYAPISSGDLIRQRLTPTYAHVARDA
jgi:isopenicillin N synthase-like dioxygenase